jgi:hypothetical protein
MTFNENDLYPTIADKTAALGCSLIQNHPFVERYGQACGTFHDARDAES